MCRFVAYSGEKLLLADVIIKPADSLINQSIKALESKNITNGDGFGVGWYVPKISTKPAVFLSILPAWNDENLLNLTNKTEASLFFAHVRSASMGGVNNYNCHPFVHNNWMLMHNGEIAHFSLIKRDLINLLDDNLYHWIRGGTDSEHFFALFLQLAKGHDLSKISTITQVMQTTFNTIQQLINRYGKPGVSYYNICLTDGLRIVASRYCTSKKAAPESLHYMQGSYFWSEKKYMQDKANKPLHSVLIASEKLTDFNDQWLDVPANHFILVDKDQSIRLEPIVTD